MRLLLLPLLLAATPAAAQLRAVPDARSAAADGADVFLLNEGAATVTAPPPASLDVNGATLVPDAGDPVTVAAGGFVKLRYRQAATAVAGVAPTAPPARDEVVLANGNGTGAGFLDRFRPYEPVYGAFGLGEDGGKLQLSLALKPFRGSVLRHLAVAYTQTMFWAYNRPSGPFTSTIYSPEVFADVPLSDRLSLAVGVRHDSNGRDDPVSIDVNRIYARLNAGWELGDGWRADVSPQLWVYFGRRGYTPDVDEYLGHGGVKASVGQVNGIKLALTARGNPGTGRGAAELFASYPLLGRGGDVGFYLFGQAFTGYAETLDRYRAHDTNARIGIALTR